MAFFRFADPVVDIGNVAASLDLNGNTGNGPRRKQFQNGDVGVGSKGNLDDSAGSIFYGNDCGRAGLPVRGNQTIDKIKNAFGGSFADGDVFRTSQLGTDS